MKIFIDYLVDLAGPLVALIGIILSYPLLKRKLTANHISWRLDKIQSSNFELYLLVQSLKDKFMPQSYHHEKLVKGDLEEIYEDIKEVYYLSLQGSSDVATLLNYLKTTIEISIRNFDKGEDKFLFKNTTYIFIINILELVGYYSNQVVQIPNSSKLQKSDFIVKPLKKFVTYSKTYRYKHFRTGVIYDPKSSYYTMFYDKADRTNHPLIMRSAYQIFNDPKPIANLLFLKKIYAPLVIESPVKNHFVGPEMHRLNLIGIIMWTTHSSKTENSKPIEECDLIYSNLNDNFQFINALARDNPTLLEFNDTYLNNKNWEFNKIKLEPRAHETIKIRMSKEYLEQNFKKNRKQFKRALK
ncbi:hypothetical protein [uncultured Christiangramia sp.]|uniref:hypothetical protein n=1 Tax=uncultured Christiangramia sp. TaxID=503836 RepID=UPI002638BFFB|nr:hypothetical protein [uncultured Christiangramia sp.]